MGLKHKNCAVGGRRWNKFALFHMSWMCFFFPSVLSCCFTVLSYFFYILKRTTFAVNGQEFECNVNSGIWCVCCSLLYYLILSLMKIPLWFVLSIQINFVKNCIRNMLFTFGQLYSAILWLFTVNRGTIFRRSKL